ncbi:TetR/AcrR family transcriptional regulator [Alkalihalobacillus oceani]|uniref:TetR/AcrR family transcriptional regulator n=1 Tax=Halalkalibacter oceani TaxID=1653776 RepID=UPI00203EB211|nr:TetR/AcrR family transcriptional regulator [Halalkalibacter oceani]MCM3762886.1 TetR/AcrR family transcriptional regulator [Halalkalibacter oceani]
MNGYQKRTNMKKESIIDAARELFTQRGVKEVSISEIAKKAGVSQVSIYNYFGDKNMLAKKALISYVEKYMERYEEILRKDVPFTDKLTMIMSEKNDAILEISGSYFSEYAWEDQTMQQVVQEVMETKAKSLYIKFIELGKEEGAIDDAIPNEVILSYLFSIIAVMQQSDFMKTDPEYKMGILKLTLYGILGKEEDSTY